MGLINFPFFFWMRNISITDPPTTLLTHTLGPSHLQLGTASIGIFDLFSAFFFLTSTLCYAFSLIFDLIFQSLKKFYIINNRYIIIYNNINDYLYVLFIFYTCQALLKQFVKSNYHLFVESHFLNNTYVNVFSLFSL